jgi:spore maturation protein CgeB
LLREINELNLSASVTYIGNLEKDELFLLMDNCFMVMSLQHISNLSNVLLESFAKGVLVCTYEEDGFNFLNDRSSIVFYKEDTEFLDYINKLRLHPNEHLQIRRECQNAVMAHFLTWSERCSIELTTVRNAIKR